MICLCNHPIFDFTTGNRNWQLYLSLCVRIDSGLSLLQVFFRLQHRDYGLPVVDFAGHDLLGKLREAVLLNVQELVLIRMALSRMKSERNMDAEGALKLFLMELAGAR